MIVAIESCVIAEVVMRLRMGLRRQGAAGGELQSRVYKNSAKNHTGERIYIIFRALRSGKK